MPVPSSQPSTAPLGGLTVSWFLASPARSFTSKASGARRTVIELRDPQRLSQSLTVFLDGEVGPVLQGVPARSVVTLHVEEVRSGRGRGELIATVARPAVEAAFQRAGSAS
jgi:hypothetical protein